MTLDTKGLDALKSPLREAAKALAASTGETKAEIAGSLGVATVVFPGPQPKLIKGMVDADALALEASLPKAVFDSLFSKVTKVAFADDFEKKLAALPTAQQSVIKKVVGIEEPTARVNLPK